MTAHQPAAADDTGDEILARIVNKLNHVNALIGETMRDLADASARGLGERLAGLPLEQVLMLRANLPDWEARRLIGAAEVLTDLPGIWRMVTDGQIAWAGVTALARHVRGLTLEQRRWVDATLAADADRLAALSPEALVDTVGALADRARPDLATDREQRAYERHFFSAQLGFDGSSAIHGELDALSTATLLAALDHAGRHHAPTGSDTDNTDTANAADVAEPDTDHGDSPNAHTDPVSGAHRSRGKRLADGLVVLANDWLAGHTPETGDGDGDGGRRARPARPSLLVATDMASLTHATTGAADRGESTEPDPATPQVVAAQVLGHIGGPFTLTPTALAMLACDATLTAVLTDGEDVLGVGKPTATIPDDVRAAVVMRDRHCRFPRCQRPAPRCHVHHVRYRSHEGPTDVDNLALLCDHHHRLVHYRGWRLTLHPDGTLTARWRQQTWTTRPNTTGLAMAAGPPPKGRPPKGRRRRRPPTASGHNRNQGAPREPVTATPDADLPF